jgi:hypothetical protein
MALLQDFSQISWDAMSEGAVAIQREEHLESAGLLLELADV